MPEAPGQDPSPSDDDAADDDESPPRQSPTDMINRNDFILFRLQGELERLKTEAAKTKEGSARSAPAGRDDEDDEQPDDPTEILERARQQIESLRKRSRRQAQPPTDSTGDDTGPRE